MLEDIAVSIESGTDAVGTGNPLPILHELRHALQSLTDEDRSTVIDLNALPFAPGELDTLLEFLGKGEVRAVVDAFGATEVQETRFNGIWLVTYRDDQHHTLTRQLEVSRVPRMLCAPPEGIRDALQFMDRELAER